MSQEKQWVPVSERQPEESDWYVVFADDGEGTYVATSFYIVGLTFSKWMEEEAFITHWMPLPAPPEPKP